MRSALVLFLTRLGSLNALEQMRSSARWRRWLGADLPSADTLGRVMAGVELSTLRQAIGDLYRNLKRGKALQATAGGLTALVIDGHQGYTTYHNALDASKGGSRRRPAIALCTTTTGWWRCCSAGLSLASGSRASPLRRG